MKKFLVVGAALLAAVPASVAMGGSSTDRATGGGQVLIGTRGGAGDTIAFTAQDRADNLGQVQYIDRTATGQTRYHGTVECVVVEDNVAFIAGTWRNQGAGDFQLYVEDNGEGANASESDVVVMDELADDPTCDFDDPGDNPDFALARGNAQVYDAE